MDQEKIGRFLKQLRQEKGLTQEQLAEQLGINPRTVSRWETARTMPDFALLVELGRRYGVTVDELLDGGRCAQSTEMEEEKAMEKIADYTRQEKQTLTRRFHRLFWAAGLLLAVAIALHGYSCAGVPLFRRNGYRQSSGRKPLFRNRDTALN